MKALHLLDSTDRGGAEILTLDLCRNAKANGLDIILVVTRKGSLFEDFRSSGVDFIFLERKMPIDLELVFKLKNIINKKGIEVIHTHQAVDGMHAYLTKQLTGVKTVMSFHGHIPAFKADFALKFLVPRMDANVAVSNSFLQRLKDDIKIDTSQNFKIVYNGIDTKKIFRTERKFRQELQLTNSDILLGMIGNFQNDGRDQLTICKTLPGILKKYPDIHFVFVGGKSKNNPLFFDQCFNYCSENNILDKTHFVGSRTDINDILNSLDLFVYSSNHDTFGIAVVEAMIAGLPVIINDLPPLLEVSDNGKYASIFKSKCPDDLERRIIELILNKQYRNQLANAGKEWALQKFSIENHISNLKQLYNSI